MAVHFEGSPYCRSISFEVPLEFMVVDFVLFVYVVHSLVLIADPLPAELAALLLPKIKKYLLFHYVGL